MKEDDSQFGEINCGQDQQKFMFFRIDCRELLFINFNLSEMKDGEET